MKKLLPWLLTLVLLLGLGTCFAIAWKKGDLPVNPIPTLRTESVTRITHSENSTQSELNTDAVRSFVSVYNDLDVALFASGTPSLEKQPLKPVNYQKQSYLLRIGSREYTLAFYTVGDPDLVTNEYPETYVKLQSKSGSSHYFSIDDPEDLKYLPSLYS